MNQYYVTRELAPPDYREGPYPTLVDAQRVLLEGLPGRGPGTITRLLKVWQKSHTDEPTTNDCNNLSGVSE